MNARMRSMMTNAPTAMPMMAMIPPYVVVPDILAPDRRTNPPSVKGDHQTDHAHDHQYQPGELNVET